MGTSVPVLEARSCAQDDERKHVLRFTADSNGLSKLPLFVQCGRPRHIDVETFHGEIVEAARRIELENPAG
jgi:hypothetical protein